MSTYSFPIETRLSQPHLRITVRGRRVLASLVTVPLVIVAFLVAMNGGVATATDSSAPLQYVAVEQGQSLWQLATELAPQTDPREVIGEIVSLNSLDSTDIVPGQSLAIPARYLTAP
jgi:LysM repeat protein